MATAVGNEGLILLRTHQKTVEHTSALSCWGWGEEVGEFTPNFDSSLCEGCSWGYDLPGTLNPPYRMSRQAPVAKGSPRAKRWGVGSLGSCKDACGLRGCGWGWNSVVMLVVSLLPNPVDWLCYSIQGPLSPILVNFFKALETCQDGQVV